VQGFILRLFAAVRDGVAEEFQRGARSGGVASLEFGLKFVELRRELRVAGVFVHPEEFRILAAGDNRI
jgi:hypothetical protein